MEGNLRALALIGLALLGSCASTKVTPFSPEPGKSGFVISCAGNIAQCYKLAETSCPAGFDVINSSTRNNGQASHTSSDLIVACKKSG